jgi:3-methylcrotonyl-CoA carboxylase alpha subunit
MPGSSRPESADEGAVSIILRAPMPGRITAIHAQPNHPVRRGSPLLTLEAMKMEHTLTAPCDGQIGMLSVESGQQVAEAAELLRFERSGE